jgi:signal transduction histidine kinase
MIINQIQLNVMDLQRPADALPTRPDSPEQCEIVGTAASAQPSDLAERIDNAREEERLALAREMHDDIGGTLSAVKLHLAALRKAPQSKAIHAELEEMAELLDGALHATERIIRALRPGILDQGLVAALEWESREFERRTRTSCRFRTNRNRLDVPKGQSLAVYRICQEALNNIAKHASASSVEVQLFRDADAVTLEISDNGCGFDPASLEQTQRFGVRGMRERAQGYGGWVELNSRPGRGTTVMLSVPLRRVQDVAS